MGWAARRGTRWPLGHRLDGHESGPMYVRRIPCPDCGDQTEALVKPGPVEDGVETRTVHCPTCDGRVQLELQAPHPFQSGVVDAVCATCGLGPSSPVHPPAPRPLVVHRTWCERSRRLEAPCNCEPTPALRCDTCGRTFAPLPDESPDDFETRVGLHAAVHPHNPTFTHGSVAPQRGDR